MSSAISTYLAVSAIGRWHLHSSIAPFHQWAMHRARQLATGSWDGYCPTGAETQACGRSLYGDSGQLTDSSRWLGRQAGTARWGVLSSSCAPGYKRLGRGSGTTGWRQAVTIPGAGRGHLLRSDYAVDQGGRSSTAEATGAPVAGFTDHFSQDVGNSVLTMVSSTEQISAVL